MGDTRNLTASGAARKQSSPDIIERHEGEIVSALCACAVELARLGCSEPAPVMRGYAAALVESIKATARDALVNPTSQAAQTATEVAHGISGEQLRVIDRYVVPLLLDAIGEPLTATETTGAVARLRRAAIAAVRDELPRVRAPETTRVPPTRCSDSAQSDPTSGSRCLGRTLLPGESSWSPLP